MILSRYTLKNINPEQVHIPDEALFALPEKVLQFGTGVLLRGLPDYFIDKANRQGLFNGRIVVVKSTAQGDSSAFEKQDGMYTLCIRGVEQGRKVEENCINASISRVLHAADEWAEVLHCAHNQQMQVIVSNTTEVGIQLVKEDIRRHPPVSFPGKLLAFLYERFRAFGGSAQSGMIVIPTELIPDNGKKLESILFELAHLNELEPAFLEWLETANHFCSSLVDRIVPGRPDESYHKILEDQLGYSDSLLTMAEAYRLWAIEGGSAVKEVLTFAAVDAGVVIAPDIRLYRELKLRLLNGTHTLSCGLAFLAGCATVKAAMDNDAICSFISQLMQQELAPAIPMEVDAEKAGAFASAVLDRFRNPHIEHQWLSITMQYSSKIKMRCIPVLLQHYRQTGDAPRLFALGFAAYLLFMKATTLQDGKYYGVLQGKQYPINDERAAGFYEKWNALSPENLVSEVLRDPYWEADLTSLPGFGSAVSEALKDMMANGITEVLDAHLSKRMITA